MDFSNLTLFQSSGNLATVGPDKRRFTAAVFDGTRGSIPKANKDDTEVYLNELEEKNNEEDILLKTMNNDLDGVYNVRKRDKIQETPQPNLLQLVRGVIEGSYFGFSTRLHASPFVLPSISRPSSSQPQLTMNCDDGFQNSIKLSSSADFTSFSRSSDETQQFQRPSTTGGRFVDSFRSNRSYTPSSTLAPSYTERNQLDYSSFARSIPGSAATKGMIEIIIIYLFIFFVHNAS